MKKSAIILASILLTLQVLAQDYNLNDYKYRYQKFKGFTNDFSWNSQGNHTSSNNLDNFNNQEATQVYGNMRSAFYLNPNYFSTVNVANLQRYINVTGNVGLDINRSAQSGSFIRNESTNYRGTNIDASYSNVTRKYFDQKFQYYQIDINGRSRSYKYNTFINNDSFYKRANFYGDVGINLNYGFGRGRLELVDEAILAMFILNDLQEITGETYTKEQIESVAIGITQIINARYLDFRFQYKEQIVMVDSVLKANGINSSDNIHTFATISDNWLYTNRGFRSTGKRWTHYAGIENSLFQTKQSENRQDVSFGYNNEIMVNSVLSLNSEYINNKQKSLHWQRGFGFNAATSIFYSNNRSVYADKSTPINTDSLSFMAPSISVNSVSRIGGSYQWVYQPNSRNLLNISLNPSIEYWRRLPNHSTNDMNIGQILPIGMIRINYYHWVSPHLNFFVNGNFQSSFNQTIYKGTNVDSRRNENQIEHWLRAGFTYQLF